MSVMSKNYTFKITVLNIVIFAIVYFFCPYLVYTLGLSPYAIKTQHTYWQFISYFFLHGSVTHLGLNMLSLYIFGSAVEGRVGSKEFLLFYMICGILAGVLSFLFFDLLGCNVLLLGASGAIYGLIIYFSCLYPRSDIYIFGLVPIKAPACIVLFFIGELLSELSVDGISHFTHCFGLLVGFIYYHLHYKVSPFEVWKRGY